jgi:RecA-family ATPase
MLYEAIHIALGLPLWGKRVVTPGPVLIITAEDDRELMAARLREIARTMMLSDEQMQTIWRDVLISDVSGQSRKLTVVKREVVMISEFTHDLVTGIHAMQRRPVLIVIDPAVSFGVGESRVNDAEQGLVEAARLLKREFGVAVRYIHHSGKANGREKALDQYAGRGGSAFADGARMVYVMAAFGPGDAAEWAKLTGSPLLEGESGIVLATPKLSYTAAQPHIYIKRLRFGFQQIEVIPEADKPVVTLDCDADKLLSWLGEQLAVGIYHSRKTAVDVGSSGIGLTKNRIRECLSYLQAMQKIRDDKREPPAGEKRGKGGAYGYLNPVGFNGWKGGDDK